MKALKSILAAVAVISAFAFTSAKTETYKVNTDKSNIEWTGKKIGGQHNGSIKLAGGTVVTNGKAPVSGNFTIDMKSISNKDITDADYNKKLVGHLTSDDFFGVAQYPTAQFVATKITPAGNGVANVTGNLTIKGITNPISFPVNYTISGNTLTAVAKGVAVNRAKYNVKYGSKSFFESIGDKAIDDDFLLDISLVAEK
ncbi:YceI family protein [Mucilaginibacter sp. KACC 22063]|uniref:YceI family protein n=1 Tax=Mucilaginibacter sp. KACC 22063 TaxID=3025666 RepID=UPI002366BD4D|nr:YceI family protein [Mucilaginibacter sp. KACC 22063]WDF54944.1 YceI family protein [Mucilaginibacter sp. KACC 22063]